MAKNQNQKTTQRISEITKIQQLECPENISNQIVPVVNVNPRPEIKVISTTLSDSVQSTALTTNSKKRTFIIGLQVSLTKDAVNDGGYSNIRAQVKGLTSPSNIFSFRYEPTTAGNITNSISFPIPIELEKNSTILLVNATATASIDLQANIYYFEEDDL